MPRKAPQIQDREKTEQEKLKARDWILQYAQEDTDSEDSSQKVVTSRLCHVNAAAHPGDSKAESTFLPSTQDACCLCLSDS